MANEETFIVLLTAEKFTLSLKLEKYARKKCAALEKYIPRKVRDGVRMEVRLKQTGTEEKHQSTCDATLHLPHASLHARETTQHMYAAIDVVTASIRHQITEYKEKHEPAKLRHKLTRKFSSDNNLE